MKILEEDQEAENDGRLRDADRPPTVTPGREGKGRELREGRKGKRLLDEILTGRTEGRTDADGPREGGADGRARICPQTKLAAVPRGTRLI